MSRKVKFKNGHKVAGKGYKIIFKADISRTPIYINYIVTRMRNGTYRHCRIAKRKSHELAVKNKNRRKNRVGLPATNYPARFRKRQCKNYIRCSLFW